MDGRGVLVAMGDAISSGVTAFSVRQPRSEANRIMSSKNLDVFGLIQRYTTTPNL